jgi:hypothetical protein
MNPFLAGPAGTQIAYIYMEPQKLRYESVKVVETVSASSTSLALSELGY